MQSPTLSARTTLTALAALGILAAAPAQAPITWTVKNIAGARTDVSTKGELCIAVNLGPEVCDQVLNGVHFQADRGHWTRKVLVRNGPVVRGVMYWPNFRSGGFVLKMPYNRAAGGIGARHTTEMDYDNVLKDGRHSSPGIQIVTCTIEGLTPGNTYEVQIFYGNKGRPTRITEWDNGAGGREGKGGIFLRPVGPHFGQVATGTFKATGTTQTFTNYQQPADNTKTPPLKETHNACCAIQIRDLTPKMNAARATYYGAGTPGTNRQPFLGGTKCSPAVSLEGHPKVSTTLKLTAENSSGNATSALIVIGPIASNVSFLGGTLLVLPSFSALVPMPQPPAMFTHDHEFQANVRMPPTPFTAYLQVLQLDANAPQGVSFTPGMKIEVGN